MTRSHEEILKRWDITSKLIEKYPSLKLPISTVEDMNLLEDKIKQIFNSFDQIFKSWGYTNVITAFELRKFTWENDSHTIMMLTNHGGSEIYININ